MASIPRTYRNIAMDMARYLTSSTPLTETRQASSRRVKTSSVIGSPTLRARPSPPHTWVTTPREVQYQMLPFEGRGRSEGGSTHHIPLNAGNGQYSRYACCEYWLHHLPVQTPPKVPGNRWEGEEKASRILPRTVLALHSLCCLSRRPSQGWGRGDT